MTINVRSRPGWEPVHLRCRGCKAELEVTEPSDFEQGMLSSGMDAHSTFEIYVHCPVCEEIVCVAKDMHDRLRPFLIQQQPRIWRGRFQCRECHEYVEITEEDFSAGNTAVGYAGETYEPALYFECPICHSRNDVTGEVPSGIQSIKFAELREKIFGTGN